MTQISGICAVMFISLVASNVVLANDSPADQASNKVAYEILQQLVETNTTDSVGNVTEAVEAMAQRFRAAGFPAADMAVVGPENPKKKNLVVRLHGTGKYKPVLLMGHLDVVEARREDWTTDPFKLVEKDGYLYGRGTSDMKDGDAIMAATLLRMKQEGYHPDRDIILALTADEEGGCCNGPDWLLKNERGLVDAEFAIDTDGWSVVSEQGVAKVFRLGATQKVYADFQLSVTNRGGHSSEPRRRQCRLSACACPAEHRRIPFPVRAEQHYARILRTGRRSVAAAACRDDSRHPQVSARSRGNQTDISAWPRTTQSFAPIAWRRASRAAMQTMRYRSALRPS